MKSWGLALTIFSLTGALAVLDMSGAHRVESANPAATRGDPKTRAPRVAVSTMAPSNAVEADHEVSGEVINAFLVMPRLTPQTLGKIVVELRYD